MGMKKPELHVTKYQGPIAVEGGCTSCPNEVFRAKLTPTMGPPEALNQLNGQFKAHFKKVHLSEDASQAAARIVREATEDH
jgi:hypothetical protein